MRETYAKVALAQMPRLLSLLDRKPASKTYGCFDRAYWQYRMIDFAGSNYQQAALAVALAYLVDMPRSRYYQNPRVLEYARAAVEFLPKIQNGDGSFNQNYPFIWSMAAVAFPVYSATEAYLLLKGKTEFSDSVIKCFRKAGEWLGRNDDLEVSNQHAGAAVALQNIFTITAEQRFRRAAEEKISKLLQRQSKEGWFPEYHGADIGYLTLCIDYLAKYYHKTGDRRVLEALRKAVDFVSYFVHPNGTAGGVYASRNNEIIIPGGFELLAHEIPFAGAIAERMVQAIPLGMSTLDDAYLTGNPHTYFQAYQWNDRKRAAALPERFGRYFEDARLLARKDLDYHLIMSAAKGGVFMLFDVRKKQLLIRDCGLVARAGDALVTSHWQDMTRNLVKGKVRGRFYKIAQPMLTTGKLFAVRSLGALQKAPKLRKRLYQGLRKLMITKAPAAPVDFEREVVLKGDTLSVKDRVRNRGGKALDLVAVEDNFTSIYGQSKDFFHPQELQTTGRLEFGSLGSRRQMTIERTYKLQPAVSYEAKVF